jgi:hypothetical protein
VKLPGRGVEYEAPAGLSIKQFPLTAGPLSLELFRNGTKTLSLSASGPVTDRPFREDNTLCSVSNGYEESWRADFGDAPPMRFSEYADEDGDGLPNWFEMYWHGKWLDPQSMVAAKPEDVPAGSGRSNLESYLQRKNPFLPDPSYAKGYVWDFLKSVPARKVSFNPDPDAEGSLVWSYLYKFGEAGKMDPLGTFETCRDSALSTPYTGRWTHFSPTSSGEPLYKSVYGWTCWKEGSEGKWLFSITPRANALLALAWKSPVDGEVSVKLSAACGGPQAYSFYVRSDKGGLLATQLLQPKEPATELSFDKLAVSKGDRLYFIGDAWPGNGANAAILIDNLQIELKETAR